jgi:hypothetical protein
MRAKLPGISLRKTGLGPSDLRPGAVVNSLTLLSAEIADGRTFWHCSCECGEITRVRQDNILAGHTVSCGCVKAAVAEERRLAQTDRAAYYRLIWKRYGTLYRDRDEAGIRSDISRESGRAWTGLTWKPE